jgi:hypothetical protein
MTTPGFISALWTYSWDRRKVGASLKFFVLAWVYLKMLPFTVSAGGGVNLLEILPHINSPKKVKPIQH